MEHEKLQKHKKIFKKKYLYLMKRVPYTLII